MLELRCRDLGFDCGGVIRAEREDDVLREAAAHARAQHGLIQLDEAAIQQIRGMIRPV